MSRRKTPAIPLKMYRHFAMATVAITATLAFVADHENTEYAAQAMAQPAPQESGKAERNNFTDARTSHGGGGRYDDGGGDSGGDGGGTLGGEGDFADSVSSAGRTAYASAADTVGQIAGAAGGHALPSVAPPGMPVEVFERLKQHKGGMTRAQVSQAQIDNLAAQSLARSGSGEGEIE